jgi:hypothetical protein
MKLKKMCRIALFILLASCSQQASADDSFAKIRQIMHQEVDKIEKEGFELSIIGDSGPNTFRGAIAAFKTSDPKYRFTSIDEARMFFVKKVEEFAAAFNQEKSIRLTLHNFPFSAKNIDLRFTFLNSDKTPLQQPYIYEILNDDGKIFYKKWNHQNKSPETFYVEQYADALRIYKSTQAKNG